MRRALIVAGVVLSAACSGGDGPSAAPPTFDAAPALARCPPPPAPVLLPCDDAAPDEALSSTGDDRLTLHRAGFDDLPGWAGDQHADAVPAFLASCQVLTTRSNRERLGASPFGGTVGDWRRACAAARGVPAGDHAAARAFFEAEFAVYAAHGSAGPRAKLSGYFVQPLRGSRTASRRYHVPVHARPADLVEVRLSDFIGDGRGRRIWGRVDRATGVLTPYPTKKEIRTAAPGTYEVLLWADNEVDVLFAGIEGSGKVAMDDGTELWIHFAGKNGRTYRGVGGVLRRMGELEKGQGTMNGIRAWFEANPERFHEVSDLSDSKVFFEIEPRAGAIGTQDVVLTPRRSIAVDRAAIALSTPVYVATRAPTSATGKVAKWNQLLVAQDTGGAILGPIRGDIYWGHDHEAAEIGGRMGGSGRMWLLLPKALSVETEP